MVVVGGGCPHRARGAAEAGDLGRARARCVLDGGWGLRMGWGGVWGGLGGGGFLQAGRRMEAAELYRKASRHPDAAKLLADMALEVPLPAVRVCVCVCVGSLSLSLSLPPSPLSLSPSLSLSPL